MRALWILLALGLAAAACGGSGDTFRRDVAVYLGCDEDDVHIERLPGQVRQVDGCGRAAVFVESCRRERGRRRCAWRCLSCGCDAVLGPNGARCRR